MNVFINGKKIRLDPKHLIGQGGEADVYRLGKGQALKIFKPADHPDYQGNVEAQASARQRLQEHQSKLRSFPPALPARVIAPEQLATEVTGQTVLGYTMPLVQGAELLMRYTERSFRQAGISAQQIVSIFRDLHQTVTQLHQTQVVIGDFNDLNVLVKGSEAFVIDADSFQFSGFGCRLFTAVFVDPLLCDVGQNQPVLIGSHSANSDWYAFSVMVMQCLIGVGPYGGVYKPSDPSLRIPHAARPLHRITIFHPDVVYPKPALPYRILPDEWLDHFHQVFERNQRGAFPAQLLHQLEWTTCLTCGLEHARAVCPHCLQVGAVKQTITVRGKVTAARYFQTEGVIVCSTMQQGRLHWLEYVQESGGSFKREDGSVVLIGAWDPLMRFGLRGNRTLIGKEGQLITLEPGHPPARIPVDSIGTLAIFAVNHSARYWIDQGQLLRDGELGSEYVGDVLPGQTRFWVGSEFGFGLYRAGEIQFAFVFDAHRRGINDTVKLPAGSGQWIDATCLFSQDRGWFLWASQEQGRTLHRCVVIKPDGIILATAQAERGDGSWLGSLAGKCAVGHSLLVATDDGVVRVDPVQAQLQVTQTFPDTEPFVDANCQLWVNQEGLHVVNRQDIYRLTIDSS